LGMGYLLLLPNIQLFGEIVLPTIRRIGNFRGWRANYREY
jgi:hypothetical protein